MSLPVFFIELPADPGEIITLPEEASRHIVQVLRMTTGESIQLSDGKGNLSTATIISDHKKKCSVRIVTTDTIAPLERTITIAISLLKNASRFEWFLEKATEIGIQQIVPLLCERTERQHFRHERMNNILVSAMLQSQQAWLPVLHQPIAYEQFFREEDTALPAQKFIAHCLDEVKTPLNKAVDPSLPSQLILIGPEGDFTAAEIELALGHHFVPVTLGETRLRAETAGIVAAALLRLG